MHGTLSRVERVRRNENKAADVVAADGTDLRHAGSVAGREPDLSSGGDHHHLGAEREQGGRVEELRAGHRLPALAAIRRAEQGIPPRDPTVLHVPAPEPNRVKDRAVGSTVHDREAFPRFAAIDGLEQHRRRPSAHRQGPSLAARKHHTAAVSTASAGARKLAYPVSSASRQNCWYTPPPPM